MNSIKDLIPQYKDDQEKVDLLKQIPYPEYKEILPELFTWIQDINWPIARDIVSLLIKARKDILPHVRNILKSSDDIWKYWTLNNVVREVPEVIKEVKGELERISQSPTVNEKSEELNILAQELLDSIK